MFISASINAKEIVFKFVSRNWLLLAVIFLALFLRLFFYMGALRGDDFNYVYYAHEVFEGSLDEAKHSPGINRPGLYVPAAFMFAVFGESEFAATLFPLLASILTVLFIYKIGTLLAGRDAGIIGAFLWAIFPLDIFMATQLDPEGPLAMTTAGSIYFLLNGIRSSKLSTKVINYLVAASFVCWAFYIKLSSAPILFVVITALIIAHWEGLRAFLKAFFKYLQRLPKTLVLTSRLFGLVAIVLLVAFVLSRQPWPIVINNLELTSTDIAATWTLGRVNPTLQDDLGGNWSQIYRAVFTPPAQPEAFTKATDTGRLRLFDVYFLVFVAAVSYAGLRKRKEMVFPLIWFAILFFYLEWGPFPRQVTLDKLSIYTPLTHWIAQDNLLYIAVPMIVVISIYIGYAVKDKMLVKSLVPAIMLVVLAAFLMQNVQTRDLTLNYMDVALLLSITLAVISPFIIFGKLKSRKNGLRYLMLLLPLMGIASLIPSPHLHVWDYFKEQERRENLLAVNSYLLEHPDLPVFAGYGALPLDIYSGFQYGYSQIRRSYVYPKQRMTADLRLIERVGGYFLVQGCSRSAVYFRDWPIREFGDENSQECISLIRKVPKQIALMELTQAKTTALNLLTVDSMREYLVTAANADRFPYFLDGLSLMATYFPEETPIVQASGIVLTWKNAEVNTRTEILASFDDENSQAWSFAPDLTTRVLHEDGDDILAVKIDQKTEDPQPIYVDVNLKPGTVYILEIDLKAFAPFDLVRFPDLRIPDSYADSWNRDLDWTKYDVVFVTPQWTGGEKVVRVELARIYDRGDIWFRSVNLIEINVND